MDHIDHRPWSRFSLWTQQRASKLQNTLKCKLWDVFKLKGKTLERKFLAGIFLILSIFLAILANEASEKSAILKWELRHMPTLRTIESVMLTRHLVRVLEPHRTQAILRSLPAQWNESSLFWLHKRRTCLSLFSQKEESEGVFIFCKKETPTDHNGTADWESMGRGWTGFEATLEALDAHREEIKAKPQRLNLSRDPREVFY